MNDPEVQQAMTYIRQQQEIAYHISPFGKWWQRWIPGMCKHRLIRCTHGDEIIGRKFRRRVCLICGHSLNGPLPTQCFFTGKPHETSKPHVIMDEM